MAEKVGGGGRKDVGGSSGGGDDRGRGAQKPSEIPARGWRDILVRVKNNLTTDDVGIVSAGVAYFAFLAIFPALGALIAVYGLVADPASAQQTLMQLAGVLPAEARGVLGGELQNIVSASPGALGLGVVISLLLALWSASSGTGALIKALNIAYHEEEHRGFFRLTGMTLLLTLGGIVLVVLAITLIVALPVVLNHVGLSSIAATVARWARWPLLAAVILVALAAAYRYAPSRAEPRWRWISWGSVLATVLWLLASFLFSFYVSHFGKFDKTYGSLAAVVILLTWMYVSAYIVMLGAEVNAEMERQTQHDTTTGSPAPLGRRRAFAADTVGETP